MEVDYLYIYTYYNLTISIFTLNPPQVSISCSTHPKKPLYFSRTQRNMLFHDIFLLFFFFSDNERLSFFVPDEGTCSPSQTPFLKLKNYAHTNDYIDPIMDTL